MLVFLIKYWKEIAIPLAVIALIFGIFFYGKAQGKMEYKAKCIARMAELRAASEKERDALQVKVDAAGKAYETLKNERSKNITRITKDYDNAKTQKTILACPATPVFVQLYRRAAGFDSVAESGTAR